MVDTATAATLPTSPEDNSRGSAEIDRELAALEASLLRDTGEQVGPAREQLSAEPTDPRQAWTQMHSPAAFIARPEVVPDPREVYRGQLRAVIAHDSNVVVNTLRGEHLDRAA